MGDSKFTRKFKNKKFSIVNKQLAAVLLITCYLLLLPAKSYGLEKITLLLKWKHQYQFAGYYAAIAHGYYQKAGLDVEIKEADSEAYTIDQVVKGNYNFGIANSGIVVHYLNGEPVVVMASICQRSPSILLVKKSSGITSAKDLQGKSIMIGETGYAGEIYAMLEEAGLKKGDFKVVAPSFSLNELLSGKVDALNAYVSNEPYFLQKFDIDYVNIAPEDYGINFYADCLFSTKEYISKHSSVADKFLAASLQGWEYAVNHQEEMAELILEKYNPTKIKDHLLFEAQTLDKFIMPNIIEIGHMDRKRWEQIAQVYYKLGLAKSDKSLDDFIYIKKDEQQAKNLIPLSITFLVIMLLAIGLAIYYFFRAKNTKIELRRAIALFKVEHRDKEKAMAEVTQSRNQLNLHIHDGKRFAEQRDAFLANLSHEVRTPMNAIVGFSNLVQKGQIDQEKYHEVFEIIQKNSLNLLKVIDNLVDLSKVQTGNLKINSNRTSINKLMQECLKHLHEEVEPSLNDKVKFNLIPPPSAIYIKTDERRLQQAVCNLANSFSRIIEEGEITLLVSEESGDIKFILREANKEISENEMRQLLEDQEVYAEPMQPLAEGVSLNISLSRELIKLLNGNLWFETSAENGTSIYISIPFVASPQKRNQPKEEVYPYKLLEKLVILVVEDDPSNSLLLKTILEKRGATVIVANNGREAVDFALFNPQIQLILMDIKLPEINGLDATKMIKKEKPNLPIIAQTAYAMEEDRYRCLEAGCDDYIIKPIIQEELFQKLQEFLTKISDNKN
jgi:ABC-type nitrate/sulfonate/bicarbonate transport systems, periplasmic components